MKSILQNKKECYITGHTGALHKHHIYPNNPNRKTSDIHGFWVYLTPEIHREVHDNPNDGTDKLLKSVCQTTYEKIHSREDFLKLIGKSYL